MHLTGQFIYPVKSLRGCALATAEVDALGLVGDRRFLVIDEHGQFLTQRTLPRMALVATALSNHTLTLSAAGAGACSIPRHAPPDQPPPLIRTVSIWSSTGLSAEDCGDSAATWLSDFLGVKCRLVRAGAAFHRPVLKPGKARPDDVVSFPDAYPLLVISEASLADLNDRIVASGEDAVPMARFRPNLVVAGCTAFAEDSWGRIRIGDVWLRGGGPCVRCAVPAIDQLTAERGQEPLRTLATYRRDAADLTNVIFGQNLFHETKSGSLRVGDPVEIA